MKKRAMRLPRMTTRRWILLVAIAALALAILSRWPPRVRLPVFDPTGELLPIEPPDWSRHADPYDPDPPRPLALAAYWLVVFLIFSVL
jgi:hypothetical protein